VGVICHQAIRPQINGILWAILLSARQNKTHDPQFLQGIQEALKG